ncbi:MAG: plastocyanin/azurin family copper-binding protein [Nitrososphaeraceae archaeon]
MIKTFEHTFDEPGIYNYFCTIHPIMTGLVNVN